MVKRDRPPTSKTRDEYAFTYREAGTLLSFKQLISFRVLQEPARSHSSKAFVAIFRGTYLAKGEMAFQHQILL